MDQNGDFVPKPHYFDSPDAAGSDTLLKLAISQGYVPKKCLLGGIVVMSEINKGNDPCGGCECNRGKCGGRDHIKEDVL